MTTVQTIYDDVKKRRVIIFQRDDGSFGFSEEQFSEKPLEMCWVPFGKYSIGYFETAACAWGEARSRVLWLSESV